MKRVYCLFLALAMTLPLLAGCQTEDATPTSLVTVPIITTASTPSISVASDTVADQTQMETVPIATSDADFVEYTNATYQLTMNVPKGFEAVESDLKHVRFENSSIDQTDITILAAVGGTLGVYDEQQIKNLYWSRSELLRLSKGDTEYELYESSISKTMDQIVIGNITFYQDEIAADYYDSKSMSQLIQPYTKAYYFYIDQNAYILNIACPPENAAEWDEIAMQMLSSVKKLDAASIEFTKDTVDQYKNETYGIAFAYPKGWAFLSGSDRIVFRKNTEPSDPLYGIQITILLSSDTFTDRDKAPEQLAPVIGASYSANEPLTEIDNVAVKNTVLSTGTTKLMGGQECPFYDIKTVVIAGKEGLGGFVDGGNIESRLYAFTTADGSVCAINISYPASGKETAANVIELVEETLTIS